MEYTQEQLDALLQQEADKRVTSALNTAKAKWEVEQKELLNKELTRVRIEAENNAKLSAEELAKKELEKKIKETETKDADIRRRENLLTAKEKLSGAEIPKSHYENFLAVLVNDDSEVSDKNIDNFIKMFGDTKSQIETELKSSLSKVPAPDIKKDKGIGEMTRVDFNKLSYAEKAKLKAENPEVFKKFIE